MSRRTQRTICRAVGFLLFVLMRGIVRGMDMGIMPVGKWNRRASNGRWKPVGSITPMYECDQCHTITLGGNFCPNCGAKMEGVSDT